MNLEITETGYDRPLVATGQVGVELISRYGSGLFQCYQGRGFSFWHNRYRFSGDTVLKARGDIPVLELHITRRGIWKGAWDGVPELDLHPAQFNLTYTPYVLTTATFRKNMVYRSCDIHFEPAYLESLAADFPELDKLLLSVTKRNATTLAGKNHTCTREMIAATEAILDNPFGPKVQPYILETKVKQVLIAALEKVAEDQARPETVLRAPEKEALHQVKQLIEDAHEQPLTHAELCRQTGMNEYLLKKGFKMLFGTSPYQYHLRVKMERAKELLLSTREPTDFIAYSLGYSQPASFGHEFKKWVGMTPGEYRKGRQR